MAGVTMAQFIEALHRIVRASRDIAFQRRIAATSLEAVYAEHCRRLAAARARHGLTAPADTGGGQ